MENNLDNTTWVQPVRRARPCRTWLGQSLGQVASLSRLWEEGMLGRQLP